MPSLLMRFIDSSQGRDSCLDYDHLLTSYVPNSGKHSDTSLSLGAFQTESKTILRHRSHHF